MSTAAASTMARRGRLYWAWRKWRALVGMFKW